MFANLKKKIESEVGDLSRLTPNLRSITHSEKLTPLSSRHNSVSSLASETSYSNKLSSPLSPTDRDGPQSMYNAGSSSKMETAGRTDNGQQKMKRVFEEKLQTQELDFAWRLNSKDEEITKLQKQVEHLNNVLHSKEFETQQKLVRVQEDMDSLEGFSQQENAKIKHLLLNREEELCQLRATVMMRDSAASDYQSQIKSVTVENDRLRKSLDEVVGRQGNFGQQKDDEADKKQLKLNEERLVALESEKQELCQSLKSKDVHIDKLQSDMRTMKQEAEVAADGLRKENSFVLKELKELSLKMDKISKESEQQNSSNSKLRQELESTRSLIETKETELNDALLAARKLQETNGALTLQLVSKSQESGDNELGTLQTEFEALKSNFNHLERELQTKDELTKKLDSELLAFKIQAEAMKGESEMEKNEIVKQLQDKSSRCNQLSEEIENYQSKVQQTEDKLASIQNSMKNMEIEYMEKLEQQHLQETVQLKEFAHDELRLENEKLKAELHRTSVACLDFENQLLQNDQLVKDLNAELIKKHSEEKIQLEQKLNEVGEYLNAVQLQLKESLGKLEELERVKVSIKSELDKSSAKNSELERLIQVKEELVINLQTQVDRSAKETVRLEQKLSTATSSLQTIRDELKESNQNVQELKQSNEKLQLNSEAKLSGLEKQLIDKDGVISSLQAELTISFEQNIKREAELVEATDSLNLLKPRLEEKKSELKSLKLQLSNLEQHMTNKSTVDTNELSKASETIKKLETELAQKEELVSELQSRLDDFGNVETENSELVLQISEIQSKSDELEEENKFLKDSIQPNEDEALKRKLVELEGELLDKNQILKQQSHQLQDLRRSLAKEINKNQTVTENVSVIETASPCNGSMSQSSAIMSMSSMQQPPTLPPQETDVNFMYLRSVMFKYLTTTDVQVTHQLTRVVATLLHLTEEEAHVLSQSAESRNSWMSHLITKS